MGNPKFLQAARDAAHGDDMADYSLAEIRRHVAWHEEQTPAELQPSCGCEDVLRDLGGRIASCEEQIAALVSVAASAPPVLPAPPIPEREPLLARLRKMFGVRHDP